jgi:hypothetical protein
VVADGTTDWVPYNPGRRAHLSPDGLQLVADPQRVFAEWVHGAASIRVPISFLVRLYPRPLDHGKPDLLERTVRLCSGMCGAPALFEQFQTSIFTSPPDSQP